MTTNERVLALVERELRKNPELKSADLKAKAVKIDKSVGKLSGRQFHARYTIQARKRLPKADKPKARTKSAKAPAKKAGARRAARKAVRTVASKARKAAKRATGGGDVAGRALRSIYREKHAELNTSVHAAFDRALDGDSLKKMDALLAHMDDQIKAFRGL